jgi:hypothetical protein
MHGTRIAFLAAILLLAPGFSGATTTDAAAPPAATAATTTVSDTLARIVASEELQRAALARLAEAGRWRELAQRTPVLEAQLADPAARVSATAELIDVITLARRLRVLRGDVSTIVDSLGSTARQLEHDRIALDSDARRWREGISQLEGQRVPEPILLHARSMEAGLQGAGARVREAQDDVLLALDRALVLAVRIDDARALTAAQEQRIRERRRQLEQSSLAQLAGTSAHLDRVAVGLRTAWRMLESYFARDGTYLAGWFFGILVLNGIIFLRGAGPDAGPARCFFPRPVQARGDGRHLFRYERLAEGDGLGQRPEPRPLLGHRTATTALLPGAVS